MGDQLETFDLSIGGMHCGACVRRVSAALGRIQGVSLTEVEVGRAQGAFDPSDTSREILAEAIKKLGFTVVEGTDARSS